MCDFIQGQLRASVWKHVAVTCCSTPSLLR
eukprot:COSAG06_NODE_50690_length_317_cov_0.527523_1_plen_29_part_01